MTHERMTWQSWGGVWVGGEEGFGKDGFYEHQVEWHSLPLRSLHEVWYDQEENKSVLVFAVWGIET